MKRLRSQQFADSTHPGAKRRRCAKTAMKNGALLFGKKESVKEEMDEIKWNHRLAFARGIGLEEQVDLISILAVFCNKAVLER